MPFFFFYSLKLVFIRTLGQIAQYIYVIHTVMYLLLLKSGLLPQSNGIRKLRLYLSDSAKNTKRPSLLSVLLALIILTGLSGIVPKELEMCDYCFCFVKWFLDGVLPCTWPLKCYFFDAPGL